MSHSAEKISCGEEEDFRAAAGNFRDDGLEGGLDEELPAEFLVVVAVVVEVGETEDGAAVLGVEGDAREADWEELVWRLDGIA